MTVERSATPAAYPRTFFLIRLLAPTYDWRGPPQEARLVSQPVSRETKVTVDSVRHRGVRGAAMSSSAPATLGPVGKLRSHAQAAARNVVSRPRSKITYARPTMVGTFPTDPSVLSFFVLLDCHRQGQATLPASRCYVQLNLVGRLSGRVQNGIAKIVSVLLWCRTTRKFTVDEPL